MATIAVAISKGDVLTGIDGQAVVLVVDSGAVDGDIGAGADVERIRVIEADSFERRVLCRKQYRVIETLF